MELTELERNIDLLLIEMMDGMTDEEQLEFLGLKDFSLD